MAIRFRDVQPNNTSSFYTCILKDVFFSDLKCYRHLSDPRNKKKVTLLDHVSSAAVSLSRNNNVFLGLPAPPRLRKCIRAVDERFPTWILAFHGFDKLVLFVLFPTEQVLSEDCVIRHRDLRSRIHMNSQNPPHSLYVDTLYVWPRPVFIKGDQKISGGLVFNIPQMFLSMDELMVEDDREAPHKLSSVSVCSNGI